MGLAAKLIQRRLSQRYIIKLLPGQLLDSTKTLIQCRPVDLSQEGLSILSEVSLTIGDRLELKTHKDVVALEVLWWKPDFGKQGLIRYGLKAIDPAVDLEIIFKEAGCLKLS